MHFYLAGINNQNFLMRDRETGSWWQQVTGQAIAGELAGSSLELMPSDELSFGVWKSETPRGLVLKPVAGHDKDYDKGWEREVAKYPVPLTFPGAGVKDRDVVLGIARGNQARAFPLDKVLQAKVLLDKVGDSPIVLVSGSDGLSVRAFLAQLDGTDLQIYRDTESSEWRVLDSQGNAWDFQGCATSGPALGHCLQKVSFLKDFWFDWKNYHPQTTVYNH